jgi:hypothetical protein
MIRRLLYALSLILLTCGLVLAQTGGQVCVRAFEDRNANGQQDNNEPYITRGISATLASGEGIIVGTALIEDSPNAANGMLCFQRLAAGQYSIRLVSADYSATTPSEFVTAVTETGIPPVLDFGGQMIASAPVVDPQAQALARQELQAYRLLSAGIGGAIAIAVVGLLGIFVYLIFMRRRAPVVPVVQARPGTSYQAARPVPAQQNAYSLYDDDDTGKSRPINPPVQPVQPPITHLPYDSVDDFRFEEDDTDSPYRRPGE